MRRYCATSSCISGERHIVLLHFRICSILLRLTLHSEAIPPLSACLGGSGRMTTALKGERKARRCLVLL